MGFRFSEQNKIISFFSSKDVIQSDRNLLFKKDKPSLEVEEKVSGVSI